MKSARQRVDDSGWMADCCPAGNVHPPLPHKIQWGWSPRETLDIGSDPRWQSPRISDHSTAGAILGIVERWSIVVALGLRPSPPPPRDVPWPEADAWQSTPTGGHSSGAARRRRILRGRRGRIFDSTRSGGSATGMANKRCGRRAVSSARARGASKQGTPGPPRRSGYSRRRLCGRSQARVALAVHQPRRQR